jgi:hypothetical protein
MATFIMLTRISPEAVKTPQVLEKLEQDAMQHIRVECPEVEWRQSYALLGQAVRISGYLQRAGCRDRDRIGALQAE